MQRDQKTIEATQKWIENAAEDFNLAKLAMTPIIPFSKAAVFHCQQAGEKALKEFLIYNGKTLRKVHDISVLAKSVLEVSPTLNDLLKKADTLSAYAIAYRYPDAAKEELTVDMVNKAITITDQVLSEIQLLL
jgi:HEPN domain-containing protein